MSALQRGPKFVSGETNSQGQVILTRADGTYSLPIPMRLFKGNVVDNGDGTVTIVDEE